jgi:RimJ/RimL family protein N-acetyltransferase
MKLNYSTILEGQSVNLVPYRRQFVNKYHEWMADPYLQEMTASEPLSIEEEYEMQQSWSEDEKKMTFIVIARDLLQDQKVGQEEVGSSESKEISWESCIERMAGDVNLFFNDRDDDRVCEIEVMIAEEKFRRQGRAKEALLLIMSYALQTCAVRRFYCKINEANEGSIALFTKALGYKEVNYVKAFQEYEYELLVEDDAAKDAIVNLAPYIERPFSLE